MIRFNAHSMDIDTYCDPTPYKLMGRCTYALPNIHLFV